MSVKCCRGCEHAEMNRIFPNQAECEIWHTGVPPYPAQLTVDTFYCAAFQPRRNSAKTIGGEEESTTEVNTDVPPIMRKFI